MTSGRPGKGDSASRRAAEVLETLRRLHGWTLVELADKTGYSRTTLDAKRRGERSWSLADAETFATVFDVSPAVFFLDEEPFWIWWTSEQRRPL